MISCVIYACVYDMVQTKNWHNGLTYRYQIWASIESNSTIDVRVL